MNEQMEQTIFSDLSNLEAALTDDKSGDRARAMISYFADVAKESVAMMQSTQAAAERQLVAQLIEAFYASLGFVAVGPPYLEDGIDHTEMLLPSRS